MLTLFGKSGKNEFADGISRRSFLQVGGLALGGAALPQILRAEAASGTGRSQKAVIMIFLAGGPPHQDMWDIKEDAPSEIRGEFKAIPTNVSGIKICEQFPLLARMADKLAFIRSMVGATGSHYAVQCLTGRSHRGRQPAGGWPCIGSVLARLEGPAKPGCPPAFGLSPKTGHAAWGDNGSPGYLGPAYAPFAPEGEAIKANMVLKDITLNRLDDRKTLLSSFDSFRREADASGQMYGLDRYQKQAIDILASNKLADAFDLSKENPKLVKRYGKGTRQLRSDGSWKRLDQFLLARRLVEAGARCVTLAFSRWDWHGGNFKRGREDMPLLDQGVSALVQDLHDRGMDKDVSVVVWGEFGRTPKINNKGGRDHWPRVSCALLAGGGMRTGQVIGSTNRLGEYADSRPVTFGEVFATLYKNLGIDTEHTTIKDFSGRPEYLVDPGAKPIRELV